MEETNFTMPVAPAYQGGSGMGWGGDWAWIIILLLAFGGGWGGGFGGGYGNMMLGYDFPWLLSGQNGINANTNAGFRDAQISDQITSVRDGISGISTQLCSGFAGTTAAITGAQNAIAQQMYTNQIADLQQSFALQSQLANCCCENRLATAGLSADLAREACASRATSTQNTQAILDKLCQLELDGYKRENDQLRSQLQFANMQASQVEQTAQLRTSQATVANQLVSELRSCPIPSQPVYGNQPIFTCGAQYSGCGCGA